MRLLVVTQYFWPENFRINDLVTELSQRGHEVTVLTGWPNYPDGTIFEAFAGDPKKYSIYENARIVRVPLIPRGSGGLGLVLNYLSFAISASLLGLWRLRGQRFDAILVYEPSPITVGIPGAVFRFAKRAPMAFWVLDLWPETLKAVGVVKSELLLRLVGLLVSSIYRRCDLILAQSRSFIAQIRRYAGKERVVEYFPNWAEPMFNGVAAEAAPELTASSEIFTVMFAGNIGEAQDFPAILDAAEILKERSDIRWLILGDGRMSDWVVQQIDKRKIGRTFQMLGRYPVGRMPSFFQHADALLVSLKDEPIFALTIPGKLQSYLAAGIPVLGMLNGEGAELINQSGSGIACTAGNSSGLAQSVLTLVKMTDSERGEMGGRGRLLYQREFNRETLMDNLENSLLRLVHENRKRRGMV